MTIFKLFFVCVCHVRSQSVLPEGDDTELLSLSQALSVKAVEPQTSRASGNETVERHASHTFMLVALSAQHTTSDINMNQI